MRAMPLDETLREIEVYVILSQISNEFFVWKTKGGGSYAAYINHARGMNKQTKKLFEQSGTEKKFPQMYVLEALETTEELAFRHCVAWTKYFMDHDLSPLSTAKVTGYTEDLLPETQEIYDEISQMSLEQALSEDKLRVKDYQKKDKSAPKKAKTEIKIYVTPEEYEEFERRAEKQNMSLSGYVKNAAMSAQIVTVNAPVYAEHIAEIRGAKVVLRQILYGILKSGKYYPADLENIQKQVDRICEQQEAFRADFRENTKVMMKLLPK